MKNGHEIEFGKLVKMADIAFANNFAATWSAVDELPLDNIFMLKTINGEEIEAYAFSKFSVVCTNGQRVKFLRLGLNDIVMLQGVLNRVYDINIPD